MFSNIFDFKFIDGPSVTISGGDFSDRYLVKFIDMDEKKIIHEMEIGCYEAAKFDDIAKYYIKWKISVDILPRKWRQHGSHFEHILDLTDKRVYLPIESEALGDNIAWMPYIEEFRKKHECYVITSTHYNSLFQTEYPEIEFVEPNTSVDNLYAEYKVSVFYYTELDLPITSRHKRDWNIIPLQSVASDILGLEHKEIKARICKNSTKNIDIKNTSKPYICIANRASTKTKYWNNPTGWQELVDYVKSLGYDVYLITNEKNNSKGVLNPKGTINIYDKSITEIINLLCGSVGFVGLASGLSWLSWSLNIPTIIISGFSDSNIEMTDVYRVINTNVCHGCYSRYIRPLQSQEIICPNIWDCCPEHAGTSREYECTTSITFDMVKPYIDKILQ